MEELRFVTLDEVPRYECFFLFPSSSLTVLSPCPRSIRESRRVPSRRVASPGLVSPRYTNFPTSIVSAGFRGKVCRWGKRGCSLSVTIVLTPASDVLCGLCSSVVRARNPRTKPLGRCKLRQRESGKEKERSEADI